MTIQPTESDGADERPDFKIVFTKLDEIAKAEPELLLEFREIHEEASSIEELRRVASSIAHPSPQTLTLS